MSKLIRVSDDVYQDLEMVRDKRETMSQVVDRLIDLWRMLNGIEPVLRGDISFHEWKDRQKERVE